MTKAFLFLTIILSTTVLSAQQIYNGSFETWYSYTNPDGWGTWASAISQYNATLGDSMIRLTIRDSTTHANYPNDTISVRLNVDTVTMPSQGLLTLAGFISLGGAFYVPPPDTNPGLRFGYYPYARKPDSLIFDYKYIPAAGYNDSALVIMTMNRFDSVTQSEVMYLSQSWLIDPVAQWTHMALKLNYLVADTFLPDSIQIIILSSVAGHLHRGTSLWVDTIHFDASIIDTSITGIPDIQNIKGVKVYPNPANDQIHILVPQSDIGSGIQLYDAEGREVFSSIIDRTDYQIHTQCLPDGVYSIRLHSRDHLTIYTGRINIVHSQ